MVDQALLDKAKEINPEQYARTENLIGASRVMLSQHNIVGVAPGQQEAVRQQFAAAIEEFLYSRFTYNVASAEREAGSSKFSDEEVQRSFAAAKSAHGDLSTLKKGKGFVADQSVSRAMDESIEQAAKEQGIPDDFLTRIFDDPQNRKPAALLKDLKSNGTPDEKKHAAALDVILQNAFLSGAVTARQSASLDRMVNDELQSFATEMQGLRRDGSSLKSAAPLPPVEADKGDVAKHAQDLVAELKENFDKKALGRAGIPANSALNLMATAAKQAHFDKGRFDKALQQFEDQLEAGNYAGNDALKPILAKHHEGGVSAEPDIAAAPEALAGDRGSRVPSRTAPEHAYHAPTAEERARGGACVAGAFADHENALRSSAVSGQMDVHALREQLNAAVEACKQAGVTGGDHVDEHGGAAGGKERDRTNQKQ